MRQRKRASRCRTKAVKLALDEIAAGKIVYRPGPRVETAIPQNNAIAAAMVDVDDTLDLDEDEEHTDSEADEDKDENADEVRRLNEFDDGSLSDGDIPEETSKPCVLQGKRLFCA